jgi:riboflavin synthase
MFTGIIEELGLVASFIRGSHSAKLAVTASEEFAKIKVGESIAVNGACLTATSVRENKIEFDVSAETIKKTTLNELRVGDKVNLEKALLFSGRLGGHMVSGHVDGIGEIRNKITLENSFELHISIPSELLHYLVSKGSIALDGVSLTVADIRNGLIIINVIPHTARSTVLADKKIGDKVNIEVDLLSKYIEKHLEGEFNQGITDETLSRTGFFPMGWIDN